MKVLVTSATRHAGLAVSRALARNGIEVVGTDDRPLLARAGKGPLQAFYRHPRTQSETHFLEAIQDILRRERPDVLLPLNGTRAITRRQAQLASQVGLLLPPWQAFATAFDKESTQRECRRLGIPCPRAFTPEEAAHYLDTGSGTGEASALVIKPRMDIGGGRGIRYVRTSRELKEWLPRLKRRWGPAGIQEYIPGGTRNMHTVNVLFDRHSRLKAWFTMRKLRQWPNRGGITALGESTRDTRLVELVQPFFQAQAWKGLAEVELKVDGRDGTPKVIEINPRIWSYIAFPVSCGINFPLIACQMALGLEPPLPPPGRYSQGVKYINLPAYAKAALAEAITPAGKRRLLGQVRRELQGPLIGLHQGAAETAAAFLKMAREIFSRPQGRL